MGKLKKFFVSNLVELKESIKMYPVTYFMTFIISILLIVIKEMYSDEAYDATDFNDQFSYVLIFYIGFVLIAWLSEILFKKVFYRIIGYIMGAVVGIEFSIRIMEDNAYVGMSRIFAGYILTCMLISVYILYKKHRINSYKYLLEIFQNLFNYFIIYLFLNIGLSAVVLMFSQLILNGEAVDDLIVDLNILLFGFFSIPAAIMAVTKKKSHISLFIKNLIKFVWYPIYLVAMIIVYIYMGKIFVLQQVPSNSIFKILSLVFIMGYPSLVLMKNYKDDNKFYKKTTTIVPMAFIPFLILQIYSISVRCVEYGLTGNRYLGIMFLVIEIFVVIASIYNKRDIYGTTLVISAMFTVIATMTPFNFEEVEMKSQLKILKSVWKEADKFDDLNGKNKEIAASTVTCMRESSYADKYIPKYISKDDLDKAETYYYEYVDINVLTEDGVDGRIKSFYYQLDENTKDYEVDIEKYSKVKYMNNFANEEDDIDKDYKKLVEKLVKKYGEDLNDKLETKKIFKLKDSVDVVFVSLNIDYVNEDDKIDVKYLYYETLELSGKADKDSKKEKDIKESKKEEKKDKDTKEKKKEEKKEKDKETKKNKKDSKKKK